MTRLEDRQILVCDIEQACGAGARLAPACAVAGIDARTLQRWKAGDGLSHGDHRVDAVRPGPSHALSDAERARIIEVANEPRFADTPPARIVPMLADEGIYLASERASTGCCVRTARCIGVGVPSRRESQGRRVLTSPLVLARSGAGM
jgi:putative transposase